MLFISGFNKKSMPELGEGIRRAKGRLLTMLIGAIKEPYRGKGLDSILGIKLLESAQKAKMEIMDSHLILELNTRMRAEYKRIGVKVHKRYRVFSKDIKQI